MTECVIDSALSLGYLARMGIELNEVTAVCAEAKEYNNEALEKYAEAAQAAHALATSASPREVRQNASRSMERARATIAKIPDWQRRIEEMRGKKNSTQSPGTMPASGLSPAVPSLPDRPLLSGWNRSSKPIGRRLWGQPASHGGRSGGDRFKEAEEHLGEISHAFDEAKDFEMAAVEHKRLCASAAAGTFASFAYSIAYVAAVVTECPGRHTRWEYCASDVARILGSMAEMAAGAAAISAQCTDGWEYIYDPSEFVDRRRLSGGSDGGIAGGIGAMFEGLEHHRERLEVRQKQAAASSAMAAECAIDVLQTAMFLTRSGAEMNAVIEHCARNRHDAFCGATISGLFAAFSMASMMLSDVAVECPQEVSFGAICSAAVSQLVGGLLELSGGSWALAGTCVDTDFEEDDEELPSELTDEGPMYGGHQSKAQVEEMERKIDEEEEDNEEIVVATGLGRGAEAAAEIVAKETREGNGVEESAGGAEESAGQGGGE